MTLIRKMSACLSFIVLLSSSCSKTEVTGPTGPRGQQGPPGTGLSVPAGTIAGKVRLYDISGNPLTDYSGATVSLENTNPAITTLSKADGSFNFDSVPAGTYNVDVSKTGYGTFRYLALQHAGGTTATQTGWLTTGQVAGGNLDINSLTIDTASTTDSGFWIITVILKNPHLTENPVILYLSDSANVNTSNFAWAFRDQFEQPNDSTLVCRNFNPSLANYSARLANATQIYAVAAMDNSHLISYADESGHPVYPCAGVQSNSVIVYNNLK